MSYTAGSKGYELDLTSRSASYPKCALALLTILIFLGLTGCSSLSQSEQKIRQEMQALESQLPPGLPRQEAYKRIRSHGLVAYNVNYTHWVLFDNNRMYRPVDHGEWPTAGETYPPTPDELYARQSSQRRAPANPPVEINFGGGYLFGRCGFQGWLQIAFDAQDRISDVRQRIDRRACEALGYR